MNTPEDLLRPSLSGLDGNARKIYSTTVGFVSAFFGGPPAAALVAMINAVRLGRVRREWPLGLGALMLAALLLLPSPWGLFDRLLAWFDEAGLRLAWRISGLGVFCISYLLHRNFHRGMSVMGVAAPSGWLLGILAIALGMAPLFLAFSTVGP